MDKILTEHYGGYTAGDPLNCSIDSTPRPTGGETRKIYNFSYYNPDGARGVISLSEGMTVYVSHGWNENGDYVLTFWASPPPWGYDYTRFWPRYLPGIGYASILAPDGNWYMSLTPTKTWYSPYITSWENNRYAKRLAEFIDKVLIATGAEKVDIVAHSMGGLVARAAIRYYGCEGKVRKLLTIGTPNKGWHGVGDAHWTEILAGHADWQRLGEDLEMNIDPEIWNINVCFMDLATGNAGLFVDFLTQPLQAEVSTIAGTRGVWYQPGGDDGIVLVSDVPLSWAEFNADVYASHGWGNAGNVEEFCLLGCTYTEEFIKNWIIDDDVSHQGATPQTENCYTFPNPWGNWELRFFAPVTDYSRALVVTAVLKDLFGNVFDDTYRAYALYKYSKTVPGTPVFATNPAQFSPGSYKLYYRVYDMDGLVVKCPSDKRMDNLGADSPARVNILTPNGGESYKFNELCEIKWAHEFYHAIDQRIYLTTDNGGNWSCIGTVSSAESTYSWRIPLGIISEQCRMRVVSYLDVTTIIDDISDSCFTIVCPLITEFYSEPDPCDVTEDSVRIKFVLQGIPAYLTMTIPDVGVTLFEEQEFVPGSYSVWWDGRDSLGRVVLPGEYLIRISCQGLVIATTTVRVKGTRVAGVLSSDEHWTEQGEPYVLIGDVQLANQPNSKLEIDPGVKVMPTGNYGIFPPVYHSGSVLLAKGNAINKILFTPHRKLYPVSDSVPKGFWKGIVRYGDRSFERLVFKYCVIEAAGSDSGAIWASPRTSYLSITETEISKSGRFGLYFDDHCDTVLVYKCHFIDNDSIPIVAPFKFIGEIYQDSFVDNKPNVIAVTAGTRDTDATIHNQGVPYWFLKGHTREFKVQGNDADCPVLSIEPGVKMLFQDSCGLYAQSRSKIIALGLPDSMIVFTALDTARPCAQGFLVWNKVFWLR